MNRLTQIWRILTGSSRIALAKVLFWIALISVSLIEPWFAAPAGMVVGAILSAKVFRATRRFSRAAGVFFGALTAYLALYIGAYMFVIPVLHIFTVPAWNYVPYVAVLFSGVIVTFWMYRRSRGTRWAQVLSYSATWLIVIALGAGVWFANNYQPVVKWQMAASLDPEVMQTLPQTNNDHPRLLPRQTARDMISFANKDNTLIPGDPHLGLDQDMNLFWRSPLYWKGDLWYNVAGSVETVVTIDASQTNMHASPAAGKEAFFLFGDRSWIAEAAFKVRHPFSQPSQAVYWKKADGKWVYLISYTSVRPTVTGTMVPYLAGVMEVDGHGWIADHGPKAAAELFPNAPLYPPALARRYADAYAEWNAGFVAKTVNKSNIMEVSETDSKDQGFNPAPYLLTFNGLGLQEVTPLEPAGNSGFALKAVLFQDATTGYPRIYYVPKEVVLNAPRKAMENVHKADTETDWGQRNLAEPRPVVSSTGKVYWLVAVLLKDTVEHPDSHSLVMSVLVDASDLSAYPVHNREELNKLLGIAPVKPASSPAKEEALPVIPAQMEQAPAAVPSDQKALPVMSSPKE